MADCRAIAVWSEDYLRYDFGDHPMSPVRLDLTMRLARDTGVLERLEVVAPVAASEADLLAIHDADYLAALRTASGEPGFVGYGLGGDDNPVFPGMFDAAALIAGGTRTAADAIVDGSATHAVNLAGGLHHAMRGAASGFCLINDIVLGIERLLAAGYTRIAYVDVDVHHGDGVQVAYYDDPRVLTVSLHEDPRFLFPGTGLPTETGRGEAAGTAVNVALPPGTGDLGWLRAFDAVVPSVVRAFDPQVLVTQSGCDTHRDDPLANLSLSVDAQARAVARCHDLAHELTEGRWLAVGGGGYNILRCVPRTWTQVLATAGGEQVPMATAIPASWTDHVRSRGVTAPLPDRFGELAPGDDDLYVASWMPGGDTWLDRSIGATRNAVFPLIGLDPDDPRD